MMVIDNKYSIGEIVYIKTDPDGYARMVLAIIYDGTICYRLGLGEDSSTHYEYEITRERSEVHIYDEED